MIVHPPLTVEELPLAEVWDGPLARGWLTGAAAVADLYAAPPVDRPWRAPVGDVAAALRAVGEPFGLSPAQTANLARLTEPGARVVVTGQQPGFLGGPLYALYKALTAIAEADRLTAAGTPTVPIFWMATEDDDMAEIAAARVLDRTGRPVVERLVVDHRAGQSVGGLRADATALRATFDRLRAALPETAFSPAVVDLGERCWGGHTLGGAFARWLNELLGERGLLLLDPTQPALRALTAPLLERVLADPLQPTRLANEVAATLTARELPIPVHREADLAAFYLYAPDGRRLRLRLVGDHLIDDDGVRHRPAELREQLRSEPERFSLGVLLRPVAQDYLLPTVGFVVGPGEVAYMAQVRPIARALQVAPAPLVPRFSATVIDARCGRYLDGCGLTPADLTEPVEALLTRLVRQTSGRAIEELAAATLAALERELAPLRATLTALEPTLDRATEGVLRRLRHEVAELEAKAVRALKRRAEVLRQRVETLHHQLRPAGQPQERGLSVAWLLAAYGPGLVTALDDACRAAGPGRHVLVRLTA